MRVFDENSQIKHSSPLMQASKFCMVAMACAALGMGAEELKPQLKAPVIEGARQPRVLSMEDCIRMALQHNLDIQIQKYQPLIDQYALNVSYSYYEPRLGFTAEHTFRSSPGGINPATGEPFPSNERETDNFAASLGGYLPTGLRYDFTGPVVEQSGTSVPPSARYSASPGVTLRQPLLNGAWIDNNRYQIQLNKNTLKIDQAALLQQIMTTVTRVQQTYYELIFARENVKVQQAALQLAQEQLAQDRKRVEVGAMAPLDEKQSQSQVASSQADLLAAQQNQIAQENLLKNLLTDNYVEWANVTPVPAEPLTVVPRELDLQESWRLAIENRPDLVQQKLNLERQNITVKYNVNQLFPTVDLTGSYGRNALNATFGGALEDIREDRNPFFAYGVVVSIPLGNGAARNNYKAAKANVKQALLELKRVEQAAIVEVENDVVQVRTDLQTIEARRAARIYAEDALQAEQKKLENGKSTTFEVLRLQRDLTTARSAEIRAMANYNQHLAELALDQGTTLKQNNIDVNMK